MSSHHSVSKSAKWSSVSINRYGEKEALGASSSGKLARVRRVLTSRLTAGLALVFLAALMAADCGIPRPGNLPVSASAGTGGLYTIIGDTPACDVLGFSILLSDIALHPQGAAASSQVTVLPSNSSPISPLVELTTLRDSPTIANFTTISAGTYDQAVLTVTVNRAAIYDPTATPPASNLGLTLTTSNITVNIQPPLTVTNGQVSMLRLDFNLAQSLEVDSQGQLTGNVNPVFTARPVVASGANGFGEFDDLDGFVRSVSTSSPGTGFTGDFLLQILPGSVGGSTALTVNLKSNDIQNFGQLYNLTTGSYVEVDAYIDSNGNLTAENSTDANENLVTTGVQVENREDITTNMVAYVGTVLTVTKDSSGNVTQFDMLEHYTEPDESYYIPINSNITVNVSSSTGFGAYSLSSDLTNQANAGNLAFNAQTLAPGQDVVVHGIYTVPASGLVSVAADNVYLRLQSTQGSFISPPIQVGSDGKTGAFHFVPCSGLLNSTPFIVVTDSQTEFVNVSGLGSLSPTTPLLVRGLSFMDVQGGSLNGVSIPADTMVLLAKHVRQF